MGKRSWDEAKLAKLKELWLAGWTAGHIGKELGKEKPAVYAKAAELKLPRRGNKMTAHAPRAVPLTESEASRYSSPSVPRLFSWEKEGDRRGW